MTRRLRCYVAAPRSLARSVVQIHTMLEDHGVRPMSLWADGVMSTTTDSLSDAALDPRRARWILDDNRKAIAASDVVFAYLPEPHESLTRYREHHSFPKETYCELEFARTQDKFIVILGSGSVVPLSLLVACHDGDAKMMATVSMAVDLIAWIGRSCHTLVDSLPCMRDLWGDDNPHQDAEDAAARWRLIPGG